MVDQLADREVYAATCGNRLFWLPGEGHEYVERTEQEQLRENLLSSSGLSSRDALFNYSLAAM